jgi:hypothetical protein
MLDGTPVLDIKPYVPYTDAIPAARSGWLDDAGAPSPGSTPRDPVPAWQVAFEPAAAEHCAWIDSRTGLALRLRICETLALGPEPHPYRRIRRDGDALLLAVKEWRVRCVVESRAIRVLEITSGYKAAQLAAAAPEVEPLRAHREFQLAFGGTGQAARSG